MMLMDILTITTACLLLVVAILYGFAVNSKLDAMHELLGSHLRDYATTVRNQEDRISRLEKYGAIPAPSVEVGSTKH